MRAVTQPRSSPLAMPSSCKPSPRCLKGWKNLASAADGMAPGSAYAVAIRWPEHHFTQDMVFLHRNPFASVAGGEQTCAGAEQRHVHSTTDATADGVRGGALERGHSVL